MALSSAIFQLLKQARRYFWRNIVNSQIVLEFLGSTGCLNYRGNLPPLQYLNTMLSVIHALPNSDHITSCSIPCYLRLAHHLKFLHQRFPQKATPQAPLLTNIIPQDPFPHLFYLKRCIIRTRATILFTYRKLLQPMQLRLLQKAESNQDLLLPLCLHL